MSTVLELKELNAHYGDAHILHGINLTIDKGESVGLIGRNGVGKTTVVNAILGVATVRRGEIFISGKKLERIKHYSAARQGVSVVPQGRMIIPNLTIEENLILGSAVQRGGKWNLDEVYALFPILKERSATPGTALSGGQQQMLAIGRALMANPDLLILDEPSEGLAPVIVDQLAEIFVEVKNSGTSVLLIEQNLSLIVRVVGKFNVMAKGLIVDRGVVSGSDVRELHKHIMI
ncbi:MAG: ABC transporter ATP-binding protein [Deltaproteobacteria bacterium]|nr:MAG: ABC transporter ATP-binding protein [Deltaproteobacteria bacterium]